MSKPTIDEKVLKQFIGTQNYFNVMGVNVTDGVKYIMDNGASWLVTDIIAWQIKPRIKILPYQTWKLKVNLEDHTAELTMQEDTGKPILVRQHYEYTDFPLKEITLWIENRVLILPSEH